MINAAYIMKIDSGNKESLEKIILPVISRTRYLPGCVKSEIWYNDESSEIMVNEIWRKECELERHIGSPLFKKLLAALELSAGQPDIRFFDCQHMRGLDFIEEVIKQNQEVVQVLPEK